MPFPQQQQQLLAQKSIDALPPGQKGVFGLYRGPVCIHIGHGDLKERLGALLKGENPDVTSKGPTHFVFQVTKNLDGMERQLVKELKPLCGQVAKQS